MLAQPAFADKNVVQKGDTLGKILKKFKMLNADGSNFNEVVNSLKKINPKLKDVNKLQRDVVVDLGDDINVPEKFRPQEIIEFDQLEKLKGRVEKTAAEMRREKARAEALQRQRLFELKRKDLLRKNIFLVEKGITFGKLSRNISLSGIAKTLIKRRLFLQKLKN